MYVNGHDRFACLAELQFANSILKPLKSIYTEMKGKIQCLRSSQELLANVVYSPDHALARNFGAESYVPKNARIGKNEACTNCYKVSWATILCLCAISFRIIVDLLCEM